MISKPPLDGWQREDRAVEVARQFGGVASKALSAGASGVARVRATYCAFLCTVMAIMLGWAAFAAGLNDGNMPTLFGAGCGSLLLGWMALRNVHSAFGRARSSPVEADFQPDTDRLGSSKDAWANTGGMARDTAPGGGSTICYDRKKLCIQAAKTFAACPLLVLALTFHTDRSLLVTLLVLAALGAALWRVAILLLRGADTDLTAVSWDDHQLRVRTLTSSRQVPWQSVETVKAIRRVRRLYGLIPISTSHELVFRLRHNGSRRTMKVLASALSIHPGAAEDLMRKLALCRARSADNAARFGNQPDFDGGRMAAQPDRGLREMEAAFAADAAEPTRAPGAYDYATIVPPAFGRKVT